MFKGSGTIGCDGQGCKASIMSMMAVMPVLALFFGALGGWIIQVTVGSWVVEGGAVLGLTIPQDSIWKLAAFLAFVGAYLKPVPTKPGESK